MHGSHLRGDSTSGATVYGGIHSDIAFRKDPWTAIALR